MKQLIKNSVQRFLGSFGYELHRIEGAWSMDSALRRAAARVNVRSVIDVGASDGRWSRLARKSFPESKYLLIEAQAQAHESGLKRLAAEAKEVQYVIAAAGGSQGTIHFDASDPFGGLASPTPFPQNDIEVPVTTIDVEVAHHGLPGPFLIKLDTHGYEIPILEGAAATLKNTNLLVIEAYNFVLTGGCLRFWDLCSYLEKRGFLPIDLCDLTHRPKDSVFWQCDLLFARQELPEFSDTSYR